MTTTRTYLKGCDWCNAKGVIPNSNPAFCGNTSFTELCPVCNGNKTVTVTEVAEMPTITDEEIKAHFTTTHKSWKEEPYQKINYDRVTGAKWMREWFRNRMTSSEKPNNCTGGEEMKKCPECNGDGQISHDYEHGEISKCVWRNGSGIIK